MHPPSLGCFASVAMTNKEFAMYESPLAAAQTRPSDEASKMVARVAFVAVTVALLFAWLATSA